MKKLRKDAQVPIISKVDKRNSSQGTLGLQVKVDRFYEQIIGADQNFGRRPIETK